MSLLHSPTQTNPYPDGCFDSSEALALQRRATDWSCDRWSRLLDRGCIFRRLVVRYLGRLRSGILRVNDRMGTQFFGATSNGPAACIEVRDHRLFRLVAMGGSLGAAEAYIRGYWDSPDLVAVLKLMARNTESMAGIEKGFPRLLRPLRVIGNWFRQNSRAGSKRNIAAHYDLSNEFFAQMLDPTMTYSCGIFSTPTSNLEQASFDKYDRICRLLRLSESDRVLEIGTGWGGLAEHAVKNHGCHVTTTTISNQQYEFAKQRFRRNGIGDKVTLLNRDYRDIDGRFDKLVSIEMIEAVGERYLPTYFAKCSDLLAPDGAMLLQAITMPESRWNQYRKSVDFIQRYIFPGGFLPSFGAIADSLAPKTDFRWCKSDDFASDYARTLACWRQNLLGNIRHVEQLGFDDRFIRTWYYYLCYCQAAFEERQIGVSQILLAKAENRLV